MVLTGGRERTAAGLRLSRILPTQATTRIIEGERVTG